MRVAATLTKTAWVLAAGAALFAAACGSAGGNLFLNDGTDAGALGPNNGDPDLSDGGFTLSELAGADPPNQWCGPPSLPMSNPIPQLHGHLRALLRLREDLTTQPSLPRRREKRTASRQEAPLSRIL